MKLSKAELPSYSSVAIFYKNVFQEPGAGGELTHPQAELPLSVDVRDVARAHILALTAPPSKTPGVGRKRFLIVGPGLTWRCAVERLRVTHPELEKEGRLKGLGTSQDGYSVMGCDVSRAANILGLKEYIPWKKTLDDMVDSILEVEKPMSE